MDNDFQKRFQKEREEEVDFGPIQRFAIMRASKEIEHFIFVEGSTDEQFYGNTNINEFREHAYYFYKKINDNSEMYDYKGKEAVFYSLKRVINSEKLSRDIENCIFVVDRDFSSKIMSKSIRLKDKDYERVLITYGHSMENYFLEEENLAQIFSKYKIVDDRFWEIYKVFSKELASYYALKAVITENFNTGINIKYRKIYLEHEIFKFDFKKKDFFLGKEKVIEECNHMKRAIERYAYLKGRVKCIEEQIMSNPRYVRGHDAFEFLKEYMKQVHSVDISFSREEFLELKKVIQLFKVNMCKE